MKIIRLSYIIAMIVYVISVYISILKHNDLALYGWSCTVILATGLIILLEIDNKKIK